MLLVDNLIFVGVANRFLGRCCAKNQRRGCYTKQLQQNSGNIVAGFWWSFKNLQHVAGTKIARKIVQRAMLHYVDFSRNKKLSLKSVSYNITLTPEQLNGHLCKFIVSVKRKDGQDYEPSSLRGLIASFNRYFKELSYPASIMEDAAFEQTRKCLEARNKQLKKQGKGNKPNAAQALTDDE